MYIYLGYSLTTKQGYVYYEYIIIVENDKKITINNKIIAENEGSRMLKLNKVLISRNSKDDFLLLYRLVYY